MPPQVQQPMPTQIPQSPINPMMMAILRARAQQGLQNGANPAMPNGLPINGAAPTPSPAMSAANMAGRAGATPNQQVTKAAQQAQSPLMDMETRNIAKQLVMKLMHHM